MPHCSNAKSYASCGGFCDSITLWYRPLPRLQRAGSGIAALLVGVGRFVSCASSAFRATLASIDNAMAATQAVRNLLEET